MITLGYTSWRNHMLYIVLQSDDALVCMSRTVSLDENILRVYVVEQHFVMYMWTQSV